MAQGMPAATKQARHAEVVARGFPPPRSSEAVLRPRESYIHAQFAACRHTAVKRMGQHCGKVGNHDASSVVNVGDGSTGSLSSAARQRRIFQHVEASLQPPPVISKPSLPETKREKSWGDAGKGGDMQTSISKVVAYTIFETEWDSSPKVRSASSVVQYLGWQLMSVGCMHHINVSWLVLHR
jgi:hypothetical protein